MLLTVFLRWSQSCGGSHRLRMPLKCHIHKAYEKMMMHFRAWESSGCQERLSSIQGALRKEEQPVRAASSRQAVVAAESEARAGRGALQLQHPRQLHEQVLFVPATLYTGFEVQARFSPNSCNARCFIVWIDGDGDLQL